MDYGAVAKKYAKDIVNGKISACRLTKLACERFLNDLRRARTKDFRYKFDASRAARVCSFVELLPHTKGEWAYKRMRIKLEPWQVFAFANIFGWVEKGTGMRRFREAYLRVARKNGKSIFAAGAGLYCFAMDDEFGAEVYSGATNERQAWEVFRPAKQMVERTPMLKEAKDISVHAKTMAIVPKGNRFEPVIAKPGDGSSPSCWIVDEYHEHDTSEQYDTALTGMGSRRQPLMLIITTAGFNVDGPCYIKDKECIDLLEGVSPDDRLFALMYGLDSPDDWRNPDALRMANPNIGISVYQDYLEAQQQKAIKDPSFQNTFKVKHCNVWVGAREAFFNMADWESCQDISLELSDFAGHECIVGGDFAAKLDLNALVLLFWRDIDGKRHYYCVSPQFYVPEDTIVDKDNKELSTKYQRFSNMGLINETSGAEIDYKAIRSGLDGINATYDVRQVALDQSGAISLMHELEDDGFNVISIPQSFSGMSDGMKELQAAISSGRFHHDGNPVMTWCISNVTGRYMSGSDDVVRPTKENRNSKIDGAVALIMAVGRVLSEPERFRSIYEAGEL